MKKIWKKLIAGGLAVVCSITAMATNGFGLFSHSEQEEIGDDIVTKDKRRNLL